MNAVIRSLGGRSASVGWLARAAVAVAVLSPVVGAGVGVGVGVGGGGVGVAVADDRQVVEQIPQVQGKYETVGGVKVFYREAGDPTAPTVVLLHGTPSSSFMFRNLIPRLAGRYHVLAPDYPGFGHSDQPDPKAYAYTFDNLAHTVDAFLQQKHVTKYSIYVQDYGGPVGMRIALAHPERVQSLIFQNANAYREGLIRPVWDTFMALWDAPTPENVAAFRKFLTPEITKFQYVAGTRHPDTLVPDPWVFDQQVLDRPGNDAVQISLATDYRTNPEQYPAWQAYLRKVQPPVLVVWGKNDPFFGTVTPEKIVSDVPKAEVHLYDTGHFALEEDVEPIAQQVLGFLGKTVK